MEKRNNSDEITFQLNFDAVNEQKIPWNNLSSSEMERSTLFECNFTKRIKEMNSQIKYNEQNLKKKR